MVQRAAGAWGVEALETLPAAGVLGLFTGVRRELFDGGGMYGGAVLGGLL